MSYRKCPRCNLNYISENESLCRICDQELRRGAQAKADEEEEMCALCGERVAVKGKDLCTSCQREVTAAVKPTDSWDYSEDSDADSVSEPADDSLPLMSESRDNMDEEDIGLDSEGEAN